MSELGDVALTTPDREVRAAGATATLEIDGVRLVDRLAAVYNAVLAVVWAILIPQWSLAALLFLVHAAAAAMPVLLRRTPQRLTRPVRILRDIYPLLWITAWWIELDSIRRLLHDANFDRVIGELDRAIFGTHLDQIFLPSLNDLWFSELMYLAYFVYYLTVIVPLLYALLWGTAAMKRDMTFRVVLIYVACFVVYIAFPVDGPHWLTEHFQGPHQAGLFYRIEQLLQSGGAALGCSFPSSHVAASTTMAILGFRWLSKPAAYALTVGAVGVIVSTVYTQNHYAIDSVAGIIWAFWIQWTVAPALIHWWECRRGAAAAAGSS
ncbi:MAG: phosphatase PAP2 family protein [Gemmatimonadetes bacterium]|uniref:Phosphatase PAP2 family protein n=1 Tax=Candidatus Kutchimonas denitrificans TaxID=3056748 RepID=A0AAE4Z7J3_9BACT|nr:phosphatase PAP2 family protein [Gemmatimonadota bacterium]NIR73701.1 phosphatase PAP2 family protein [Candidatus Kutchimonas denitrificans]NIS00751.1 phosphatase PAP2 family protein [Gemmatimonadota bacterium]NIT66338.1 phosphatase PAP2 family protein [Gemmatimonadota bacterium]NIU51556.1 phosphatase PAP2 family protein [Gemmatimonadota bacterium]